MAHAGFLVGFVGDGLLQLSDNASVKNAFSQYFAEKGSIVSMLTAGALTSFWTMFFESFRWDEIYSIPFAMFIDEVYRVYHNYLFPSLAKYYQVFPRERTLLFNGITALLVIMTKRIIE